MPGSKGHALGKPVGACIVDMWDTTISKSDERLEMERRATVAALKSDAFGRALKGVKHGQIAMNMAFWHRTQASITGGWVLVDQNSRFDLADKVASAPRNGSGYTHTHEAVLFTLKELETCQSERPIIDIVTDGKTNISGFWK